MIWEGIVFFLGVMGIFCLLWLINIVGEVKCCLGKEVSFGGYDMDGYIIGGVFGFVECWVWFGIIVCCCVVVVRI